jgi:short-subunit dehydrogenase
MWRSKSLPTSSREILRPAGDDSWALVTGATSGIGEAYARELASRGYRLMLTGRREAALRAVAGDLGEERAEVHLLELSDEAGIERLLDSCRLRRIEVLVNNAGFGIEGTFLSGSFSPQRAMARVHVEAPMRLIHALGPGMVAEGRGAIVNVASLACFMPLPGSASYSATKAFLRILSESLAMELRGTGVRVQALCPGFTRTHFHAALGIPETKLRDRLFLRWGSPREVVRSSIRALEADRVLCVPGFWNRAIRRLVPLIPRRLYYALVSKFR